MKKSDLPACYFSDERIETLLEGEPLTTCEPKEHLEKTQPGFTAEHLAAVGTEVQIFDSKKRPRGEARIVEALETTFGNPSPVLLAGIGLDDEPQTFQQEYGEFLTEAFPDLTVTDKTPLIVTVYKMVSDEDEVGGDEDEDEDEDEDFDDEDQDDEDQDDEFDDEDSDEGLSEEFDDEDLEDDDEDSEEELDEDLDEEELDVPEDFDDVETPKKRH